MVKKKKFIVSGNIGGKRVIISGTTPRFSSRRIAQKRLSKEVKRFKKKGIRLMNPRLIEVY